MFPEGIVAQAKRVTGNPDIPRIYVPTGTIVRAGYKTSDNMSSELYLTNLGDVRPDISTATEVDRECPTLHWLTATLHTAGFTVLQWYDADYDRHDLLVYATDGPGLETHRCEGICYLEREQAIWRAVTATGCPERMVRHVAQRAKARNVLPAIRLANWFVEKHGQDVPKIYNEIRRLQHISNDRRITALKGSPVDGANYTAVTNTLIGVLLIFTNYPEYVR